MANIPGIAGYNQPGVFSRVRTIRRAVSIPGGLRILSIIGLGKAEETIILSAQGNGQDGVNPDYAASSAPDGRHFILSSTNLVPKRTEIYKNSIPLTGIEQAISTNPFDSRYDYRIEPTTGRIELQRAHLVSQGGTYSPASPNNIGNGSISSLTLIDVNAPSETWTIRATSVIRDAYGDPISGVTVFTAVGSQSGQPVDAYGAPVTFISNGVVADNGIISLAITEGSVAFDRGDRFTIKVESGVLKVGDTLEAKYISNADLYDPEFFTDANALYAKHGVASEENTLSLGASIAFENGAFGVLALQPKPPVPRRTSEVVITRDNPLSTDVEGFPALSYPVNLAGSEFFKYALDGIPDSDTALNLLVIDKTSGTESQIFPSKVTFYDSAITSDPYNNFISSDSSYTYSYTVIMDGQIEDSGTDGVIVLGGSSFSANSAAFSTYNLDVGESDTLKKIRILSKDKNGESVDDVGTVSGIYDIASVGDAYGDDTVVTLSGITWPESRTDLIWQLVDTADESAKVLLTEDLASGGAISRGDGLRVSYIDVDDADFFDTNWGDAFEQLETAECQIVVPLPNATYSAIQQAAVAHCELMSNTANQRERVALIGAQQGVTSESLIGRELIAVEDVGVVEGIQGDDAEEVLAGNIEDLQNFDLETNWGHTFRAVYFWPDQIVRSIAGTNTYIHGFYMAAAAGGRLAATPNIAIPLTKKILTGFTILRDKIRRPIILNQLGSKGVSVVQPVVGGGQILHCKTTTNSGAATEEELSVVFIRDRTAQVLRSVLAGFIGNAEDPTLVASITAKVQNALRALTSQGLLTTFKNLSVKRDQVEPRQWNVSVEVQPTLPVNWIFIDVSVGIF